MSKYKSIDGWPRTVMGLSALAHDPSASLFVDGKLVSAVEEEKLSRIKNTYDFPVNSINYVLFDAGIKLTDLDAIAYYWDDRTEFISSVYRTLAHLTAHPSGILSLVMSRFRSLSSAARLKGELKKLLDNERGVLPPVYFINHHEAHAVSAIASAPFDPDGAIVMDGRGEYAATSLYDIKHSTKGYSLRLIKNYAFPNSLGVYFGAITQLLGEQAMSDEYKIMGLASYGVNDSTEWKEKLSHFLRIKKNGDYQLNITMLNPANCSAPYHSWLNEEGIKLFGDGFRSSNGNFEKNSSDLAHAAQERLVEAMEQLLKKLSLEAGVKKVVMAGGVLMNANAVGYLRSLNIVEQLHIPLAPADSGASIGAALTCLNRFGYYIQRNEELLNPFLGPSFSEEEIEKTLNQSLWSYEKLEDASFEAACEIADGKVLGWFEGRMEFGARALGARSILGDPRNPEMRSIINRVVKNREMYRPFAPSILEEESSKYFKTTKNRLMGEIVEATPLAVKTVPSVVHVDNTARPQTVPENWPNTHFRRLIEEFCKISGVPMVINTSFNVKGEPIVCSPDDALRCFAVTGIDTLYMPPFRIRKK